MQSIANSGADSGELLTLLNEVLEREEWVAMKEEGDPYRQYAPNDALLNSTKNLIRTLDYENDTRLRAMLTRIKALEAHKAAMVNRRGAVKPLATLDSISGELKVWAFTRKTKPRLMHRVRMYEESARVLMLIQGPISVDTVGKGVGFDDLDAVEQFNADTEKFNAETIAELARLPYSETGWKVGEPLTALKLQGIALRLLNDWSAQIQSAYYERDGSRLGVFEVQQKSNTANVLVPGPWTWWWANGSARKLVKETLAQVNL